MKRCAECGGSMGRGTTALRLEVAGRSFRATLPASVCKSCDEAYVDQRVLEAFELSVARELATTGATDGEAFKFMRKALGLRAVDVAELFGVAAETVSRWENGAREVDRGSLVALGSVVLDRLAGRTVTLDRLRALHEPPKVAKVVTVDVAAPRPKRTA